MNFAYRSFIQVARQDFKRASRREHPMTLAVAWRAIFLVPALACGVSVHAQIVTTTPAIPDTKIVSPGGVDMRSGDYVDESTDLSIGPAAGGLTFVRVPKKFGVGFTSNWHFNVSRKNHGEPGAGFYYQFENKAIAKTFYSPQDLSYFVEVSFTDGFSDLQLLSSGTSRYFMYTALDGTTTRFQPTSTGAGAFAEEIRHPDGAVYTFAYDTGGLSGSTRLRRVISNRGYQLILEYYGAPNNSNISKVCAINTTVTAPPASHFCPSDARSASYTYAGNGRLASITNTAGQVTAITNTYISPTAPFSESFYKPGMSIPWLTNTYDVNLTIYVSQQAFADGRTLNYSFEYIGSGELPNGQVRVGTSWTENSQNTTLLGWEYLQLRTEFTPALKPGPTAIIDPLGRTSSTTFDDRFVHVLAVTKPNGLATNYTYGGSVVTQKRLTPATGFSDAPLVINYTYDCTYPVNCQKPTTMTDARGFTTDYSYDPTHGGLLTETLSAPTSGAPRPQTRYTWNQFYAWYYDANGSLVQDPTPVWLVSSISECRSNAVCAGTNDETRTTFTYGAPGTPNNLLLTQRTVSAGDGSVSATTSYTYDLNGDILSVDGPLPGSADTTVTKYDMLRRTVGVIGPDPDGGGPLTYRATRNTFDAAGRLVSVEQGTTPGQSDADFAAFSPLESVATDYDLLDRPIKVTKSGGGTAYAVTQYSYDTFGRLECTAVRMDPAQWNAQTNACFPQTSGPNGPDRIARNIYDAAGQLITNQVAVGTADQADDETYTYTLNGKPATVEDGENNRTTYEYDGFDRLSRTRFPIPAQGAQTSSTSDYEQLSYDPSSNITQRRLRDGQVINSSYDALNRSILKDLPAPEADVSYGYDLQGRTLTATQGASYVSLSYDALGRTLSEVTSQGVMSYQYDLAGRRIRTTWSDGFYVSQDFLMTGELSAIRENGVTSGVGVLATYSYDNLGRRTSINRGNGTTSIFSYDGIARLAGLSHNLAGTAEDVSSTFAYNPASQIVTWTRDNDAYLWVPTNQNKLSAVNGLNQLTSFGGVSIGYDLRGNLTSQGASLYTYTVENRLVNGPSGAAFTYDPTGRLSQSSGASGTMQYQYDGTDLTAEYNTSGQLQRRYVHGPGADEPLVWYEGSGTTDRRWFHQDERGSIVALSNSSGAMIAIDSYDEYGIPASTNLGRFQYTGQTWMPEIGMYYYKARVYSPTLGRFLQTDPIGYGDGINWYAYVGNDPMDRTDPSGTYSCGSSLSEGQCKDFTAAQEAAKKQITAAVGALKGIQSKIDSGGKLTSAEQKVADSVSKVLGKGAGTNSKALGNLIDKAGKIQGELNGSKPAEFGGENKFFSADAGNPTKLVLYQSFFSSSEKYQSQTVAHEGFHHGTGLKDIGQQTNNGDYIGPYGYQNAIRRADYYHNPLEAMRNPDAVTYALGFEDSP